MMKELKIHIKIDNDKVITAINKLGFDNSASSNFEVVGILQNLIRIEQDKMNTHAKAKISSDLSEDKTKVFDLEDKNQDL